jgi:L,D-transpeptidase ErfK/SrfK
MTKQRIVTGLFTVTVGCLLSAPFSKAVAQDAPKIQQVIKPNEHPKIQPVIGKYEKYTVKKGETLYKIARHHNVSVSGILRANHRRSSKVKVGQTLLLPTLYILPRNPGTAIVLNVPERALYVVRAGAVEARYPVAVGKADWQTALGEFKVKKKVLNPDWQPTREMVEREHMKDDPVPPGKENPLGDRWIGWTKSGFGFHSTTVPTSIGEVTSHGCVRLYPEGAHKLFDQVSVGMPILSVYEPVMVGQLNGNYYLSVFSDVYHSGATTLPQVEKFLQKAGLPGTVDKKELAKLVKLQDGYPHRIPLLGAQQNAAAKQEDKATPAKAPTPSTSKGAH